MKTKEISIGKMHKRNDLHLARKCFHMSGALVILIPFLYFEQSRLVMTAFLGVSLAFVMSLEYARARWETVNNYCFQLLGPIMRRSEVDQISGIPFYNASSLFAILIFPKHIAALSILYLALGDPSSSFFGVLWGKDRLFPNKSLQGALGGFFVCALTTYIYLWFTGITMEKRLIIAMIGGLAGAIAELLPLNIDDNFSIPLISGAILALLFWCAELPMS